MGRLGPFSENTIVVGDCLDVMAQMPDGCVDLVVTDPPYPKQFSYLYGYLADECPRIMKRGASLFAITPHYLLPEVIRVFNNKLKYRWILCMNQFQGAHARMAMGIEITWKPILWYVKEAYPQGRGFVPDGFIVSGRAGEKKELHEWEQDSSWAYFLIDKFSNPDDLIFDPFMGSGTTAVVADRLGRNFFGCDISEEYVEMALKRLEKDRAGRQLALL